MVVGPPQRRKMHVRRAFRGRGAPQRRKMHVRRAFRGRGAPQRRKMHVRRAVPYCQASRSAEMRVRRAAVLTGCPLAPHIALAPASRGSPKSRARRSAPARAQGEPPKPPHRACARSGGTAETAPPAANTPAGPWIRCRTGTRYACCREGHPPGWLQRDRGASGGRRAWGAAKSALRRGGEGRGAPAGRGRPGLAGPRRARARRAVPCRTGRGATPGEREPRARVAVAPCAVL